jgi:opacity protein-like surface antigen
MPLMVKYNVANKFNLLFGPQFAYTLEEVSPEFTKLGVSLGFGASYDFNKNFFAEVKYQFQINNYYTGSQDLSSKINFSTIGIGYRF